MSTKKYDIKIPKEDYQIISVGFLDTQKQLTPLGNDDLLFMTVRHSPEDEEFKFQKTLENGIVYNQDTGKYDITINSIDTKELLLNEEYGYDITVYYDGIKPKQKVVGKFIVTDKFTTMRWSNG